MQTDSDEDGLSDGEEVTVYETNPTIVDTDGDQLTDHQEVKLYQTNPLITDTDGDEFPDYEEISAGTNPQDPDDYPISSTVTVMTTTSGIETSSTGAAVTQTSQVETNGAFIPGFGVVELGFGLGCLVIGLRMGRKR